MSRHFPYVSAALTTAAVGAITSVVFAAQVPVLHPGVAPHPAVHPAVAVGGAGPSSGAAPPVSLANTPGTGPAALPPGFQQSAAFGNTGMSQSGQPPYGEMFYSMQTYMNQPGQPDYYDRLGINPTAIEASQGITPLRPATSTSAPTATATSTSTSTSNTTPLPNSIGLQSTPTNTGSTVGFYNGFGPGSPNFGFFTGFTTPR